MEPAATRSRSAGGRLPVRRPRVRSVGEDGRELTLESHQTFAATDLLADGIVARMLAGLSTRRYEVGLEPVGNAVEQVASGTSGLIALKTPPGP